MTNAAKCESSSKAYSGLASNYQNRRPRYQEELVELVLSKLPVDSQRRLVVYDIGCGTGIFARQLAAIANQPLDIVGVEPNEDMRNKAIEVTPPALRVRYIFGHAEALPIKDGSASLITAASAATWFDREKFYLECARSLHTRGILGIAMIRRDLSQAGFTLDYEIYQERALPGFKRGTFENHSGDYRPVDFQVELQQHDAFIIVGFKKWPWQQKLSFDGFLELSLSRSDTKKIVALHGLKSVQHEHIRLFERYADSDGFVTMAWISEVLVASRR